MTAWDEERLRELSKEKLRTLYENALARPSDEAAEIVALIHEIGVPPKASSGTIDSPILRKMKEVIFSKEAQELGLKAATMGLAPMGVIDPLVKEALGADYKAEDRGTLEAGFMVAAMMRENHWEPKGKPQKLPEDCVAKTAAVYVHIPSNRAAT